MGAVGSLSSSRLGADGGPLQNTAKLSLTVVVEGEGSYYRRLCGSLAFPPLLSSVSDGPNSNPVALCSSLLPCVSLFCCMFRRRCCMMLCHQAAQFPTVGGTSAARVAPVTRTDPVSSDCAAKRDVPGADVVSTWVTTSFRILTGRRLVRIHFICLTEVRPNQNWPIFMFETIHEICGVPRWPTRACLYERPGGAIRQSRQTMKDNVFFLRRTLVSRHQNCGNGCGARSPVGINKILPQ